MNNYLSLVKREEACLSQAKANEVLPSMSSHAVVTFEESNPASQGKNKLLLV